MSGHVDVATVVAAPLDRVWTAANDPAEWGRAGHPVAGLTRVGDRMRFRVTTPVGPGGAAVSYTVERIADADAHTVYSRREDSPDFLYSHVWFGYAERGDATEMRCVCDFEMTPAAALTDAQMTEVMTAGLLKNLQETARRIEHTTEESNDG